jgi:phosphatidylglycerophosphatase A
MFFIKLITSCLGIGYMPLIPGTFGSVVGMMIFVFLQKNSFGIYISLAVLLFLGFSLCTKAEEAFGKKDPKQVVIDEACGMILSLVFLPFYDLEIFLFAFFLFRALDTIKPFPAGWIESRHGSLGIMGDDIAAGIYANIVLQLLTRVLLNLH